MKNIRLILALLLVYAGHFMLPAQETVEFHGLHWYLDYEKAKQVALKEHKPIVILFTGSDWCPPCKALEKEVFPNKLFREKAEKVILVLADFPRYKSLSAVQKARNRRLATRFLGRSGVPTMVAVDPRTETVIRRISGYNFYKHDIQPHLNFMKYVIDFYNQK